MEHHKETGDNKADRLGNPNFWYQRVGLPFSFPVGSLALRNKKLKGLRIYEKNDWKYRANNGILEPNIKKGLQTPAAALKAPGFYYDNKSIILAEKGGMTMLWEIMNQHISLPQYL